MQLPNSTRWSVISLIFLTSIIVLPLAYANHKAGTGDVIKKTYASAGLTPTPSSQNSEGVETKAALAVTIEEAKTESDQKEKIEAYIKTIFRQEPDMAVEVTHHECSPQRKEYPGCVKKDNIEWSCGIWQINLRDPKTMQLIHAAKVPGETLEEKCETLKNPYTSTLIAYYIYSHQGFCPWTWYKNNYCK